MLQVQILATQRYFLAHRDQLPVLGQQTAKQFGQVFERAFRALGIAPNDRQNRIQTVEQEMRPDARLQRLEPCLGERR